MREHDHGKVVARYRGGDLHVQREVASSRGSHSLRFVVTLISACTTSEILALMMAPQHESAADRYRRLAERFTTIVEAVPADAWNNASPCQGWTAADVLAHVIDSEAGLLKKTGEDVSSRAGTRDDQVAAWMSVRGAVQAALDDPQLAGIEYESFGMPTTIAATFGSFMSVDLVVHGWDIAHAAGIDDAIATEDMGFVRAFTEQMGDMAQTSGAFGPRLSVPKDADEQTKFLALIGRPTNWAASNR